jgi:SAM-dependent methyltransferase
VDLTASYIHRARRRAASRGLAVRFVPGDMRELPFDKEFHAVVNWFSSFGYFSDGDNLAAARAAWRALRPGGQVLIEVMNKTWVRRHWRPDTEEVHNGVRIRSQAWWDGRTGRVRNIWTMTRARQRERHAFSMRLYSAAELRRLLARAGFCDIRVLARPKLGRVTRCTRRMMAIGRRPR